MVSVPKALALGFAQLFDGTVLRVLLKSVGMSLVAFAALAAIGWWAFDGLLAWGGLGDGAFAGAQSARGLLSLLAVIAALWLGWRVVAMAVVQFFAEDVVQAVERRHYPGDAETARRLSFAEEAKKALGSAGRALLANAIALPVALVLMFTAVGPFIIFLLVNAVLIGRELQDMVWLRYRHDREEKAPLARGQRLLLGGVIAGLLAIPFVNFLAPVLGAAAATHLVHRQRAAIRGAR